MKANYFLMTILMVFLVTVMHHTNIGRTYYDNVNPGDEMMLLTNIDNQNNDDINNAKVIFFVPELDLYWRSSTSFDLDSNDKTSKFLFPEIDADAEPGAYRARVTVSSDDTRESDWTWLIVE